MYPPGIGNTPTLTRSKRTENRNPPFATEARWVWQTHSVFLSFFWWVKCRCVCVPSKVCCRKVALLRAHLRVRACTDTLLSPCHHPPVSSLSPRISLVGRTVAPSQLQTAPTPRRCSRSKDQKTNQMSVLDIAIWNDMEVIFACVKRCSKASKKTQNSKRNDVFL